MVHLYIGVLKLGILNGSYTIPHDRKSPLPVGVANNAELNRNRHTFSEEYISLIQSMLQLFYKNRPYAMEIRSKCDELLQSKYNLCIDNL